VIVRVTRTYLQLLAPDQLRRVALPGAARLVSLDPVPLARYRELYRDVGGPWHWRDRLAWSDEQLTEHLASMDIAVRELVVAGETAGFVELRRDGDEGVEIAYFGLLPSYIGRGLGGGFLTAAADEAWRMGARRVWLHTCTLDSPHALPNYRARGFEPYRDESYEVDLPHNNDDNTLSADLHG
jgi:GNAT superfamily N-acetyltransferase